MAKVRSKASGGSTLKRLRTNLKSAGLLAPKPSNRGKKDIANRDNKLQKLRDTVNPFELKFNREKHQVMNRKTRGTTGKPGESKQKGHENVRRSNTIFLNSNHVSYYREKRHFWQNKQPRKRSINSMISVLVRTTQI